MFCRVDGESQVPDRSGRSLNLLLSKRNRNRVFDHCRFLLDLERETDVEVSYQAITQQYP